LIADRERLFAEAFATVLEGPDIHVFEDHPTGGLGAVKAAIRRRPDVALRGIRVLSIWPPRSNY